MGKTSTEQSKARRERKRVSKKKKSKKNGAKRRRESTISTANKPTDESQPSTSAAVAPSASCEPPLQDTNISDESVLNVSSSQSVIISKKKELDIPQNKIQGLLKQNNKTENNGLLKKKIKQINNSDKKQIRLKVSQRDLNVLKEFFKTHPNLSKAQIWRKWRKVTGKNFSISTCRRAIAKLGKKNQINEQVSTKEDHSCDDDVVEVPADDSIKTEATNFKTLTKNDIESKLNDPKEKENFTFQSNEKQQENAVWNFFLVLYYHGEKLDFVKCKTCSAIFEADKTNSVKILMQHECFKNEQTTKSISGDSSPKRALTPASFEYVEKSDLLAAMNDENESDNFKFRSKKSFKCFAWEYLDLIFYKDVQQPFAQCRYCRSLVTFTNKNGTSSIRKHVSRCSKIPLNSKVPVRAITPPPPVDDDDVECSTENGAQNEEEEMSPDMFIPEIVYNEGPLSPEAKVSKDTKTPIVDKTKLVTESTVDLTVASGDESTQQSQEHLNIFDKFKLQDFYEDPEEKKNFRFEAPTHRDDAAYWKLFDYVYYKDVRQHYCRCKRCGVYINFVTTRRRGLARHMRSCNKKFIQEAFVQTKKTPKSKTATQNKAANTKATKAPTSNAIPTTQQKTTTNLPPTVPITATLATPPQKTTSILQATLNKGKSKQSSPSIPPELKAQLALNQLQFIGKDLQTLDYFESENFRKFCQNLITVGAQCGSQKIDDLLSSKDSILKFVIPSKISKIKKHIRHLLINENHLNIGVDIYENKLHDRMTFKYYLTITIHLITDEFEYQCYTLGTKDLSETVTPEEIRKGFLKIVGDYFDIQDLENKCYVVIRNDNAIFNKAFEKFNCLPNVGYNMKKLINNLLLSDVVNPEIHANVKRIQDLFIYLNTNYNYHSASSDSALEQMEEFYEMFKTIEKLLKENNDVQRMTSISRHSVKTVINLLEMIKLCQDTLYESSITISGILLWKKKLLDHYTPALHEHKFTEDLKRVTMNMLEAKFHTEYDLYKIALFLNPNFKTLKFLSPPEKDYVHMRAKEMIDEIEADENKSHEPENIDGAQEESPAKRLKSEKVFEDYLDVPTQAQEKRIETIDEEISRYATDSRVYNNCDDLLDFWRRSTNFPYLRKLAKKILGIPTCAHGVNETVLLKANKSYRDVYGQKMLSIEEYNNIIFINCNFDLVENSL